MRVDTGPPKALRGDLPTRSKVGPEAGGLSALAVDLVLGVCLALLPWLYFWRLFAPSPVDQRTILEGDFTHEYFPVLVTAARAIRDGALPLWNPYANGGQPLLADPQAALLYPVTWLALASIQGYDGQSLVALERLIPLHFGLAAVFAYALGRVLVGSRLGALVVSLVFTYSGFLTSYPVQQLPILRSVAWFPLQVLGVWLSLQRSQPGWAAVSGVALGMAMLAGHPQTVFLEAVGLVVIAAAWAYQFCTLAGRLWPAGRALAVLGLTVAVGAGVSAGQWLPTLEFTLLSSRAAVGYDFLAAGFSLWELPLDLIAPRMLGGLPPYVGVLSLVLVAVALRTRWSIEHGVALGLVGAGLLLALGGHTFLFSLLYLSVPGFDLFRQQERAIFLATMGFALLAGLGASVLAGQLTLLDRCRLRRLVAAGGLGVAGALAFGGLLYIAQLRAEVSGQGVQRWRDLVHWYFFFVLLLAASLALVRARLSGRLLQPLVPLALVLLLVLDLFTVSWEVNLQDRRPDEVFRASEIVNRTLSEIGLGRAVDQGVLNGNHGLVYGIPTVTESFALHLDRFEQAARRLPEQRWFDLLNVRYVITRQERADYGDLVLREQFRDVVNLLYRRRGESQAAWIVPEAIAVATPDEALERLAEPGFDIRRSVLLEAPPYPLPRGGAGEVRSLERGWNRLQADVIAPQGGYLVLSEIAYPGWRAEVDGRSRPILRANYLLRAVWLEPGEHRVVLTFAPESVRLGLGVSGTTVVLLFLWSIIALGRSALGRRGLDR